MTHLRSAWLYDYDITHLRQELSTALERRHPLWDLPPDEDILLLWIIHHLHQFDLVSVVGYNPTAYPASLINFFNNSKPTAVSWLYNTIKIPYHATGVEVVLHRLGNRLWVVFLI